MSENLIVYPQGYKTFSFDTITNDTNAIGKGSDNTTYATLTAYQGDTSVVQWPFDLSAIPDGAEINSVVCEVHIRFSYGVSSTTAKIQLATGSVLKGSSVSLPQEPSEGEVLTITDAGTWTRDELQSCNLYIEATSASNTSNYAREIRFYGADLTVTYTVKGKKIMLRLNDFPGLPEGYTRLEYVESSGAQYVDTGFQPNQDTRVVIECEPTVTTSSQMAVFGARNSNSGQATLAYGFNVMTSTSCRSDYMGTNATISGDYPAGTRISVDMNKNICTVNGKTGNTTAKTGQTPYNLFLFNVNNIGTPHSTFGFKGKIYSCQIYDNGTKIRDYIPAKNPSGVPGLYDLINNTFSSSGTSTSLVAGPVNNKVWHDVARVFKKINGTWIEQTELADVIKDGVRYKKGEKTVSTLPFGYTRLDYIQSSGAQYINTNYKATSENYQIKCKFATTNDEINTVIFGGGASTDTISALLQSTNQIRFYVGSGYVSSTTATFARGAECELECHANTGTFTVNLDGVAYTGSYSETINKDWPLFIFANNVSGTASQFSSIRLYAFQIYDNGNMVRNLIPCVNANNVAGMYDLVNGVFYSSNSGTQFVAGPQISSGTTESTIPVTITGFGDATLAYVTINGTKYTSPANISVPTGTVVTCTVEDEFEGDYEDLCYIKVNETTVLQGEDGAYNYTVTAPCTIALSTDEDAGYGYGIIKITQSSGGSGSTNLISFTIEGTSYQSVPGMTWEEWVQSTYNTDNLWRVDQGNLVLRDGPYSGTFYIVQFSSKDVSPSDKIVSGRNYTTEFG